MHPLTPAPDKEAGSCYSARSSPLASTHYHVKLPASWIRARRRAKGRGSLRSQRAENTFVICNSRTGMSRGCSRREVQLPTCLRGTNWSRRSQRERTGRRRVCNFNARRQYSPSSRCRVGKLLVRVQEVSREMSLGYRYTPSSLEHTLLVAVYPCTRVARRPCAQKPNENASVLVHHISKATRSCIRSISIEKCTAQFNSFFVYFWNV